MSGWDYGRHQEALLMLAGQENAMDVWEQKSGSLRWGELNPAQARQGDPWSGSHEARTTIPVRAA